MSVGRLTGEYGVTGHGVLVEHLTPKEAMDTILTLTSKSTPQYNQAYVLQIGPMVKADEWGIAVGDRVLVQGSYVPVPRAKEDDSPRELGILDPTSIKCVLKETGLARN